MTTFIMSHSASSNNNFCKTLTNVPILRINVKQPDVGRLALAWGPIGPRQPTTNTYPNNIFFSTFTNNEFSSHNECKPHHRQWL
jgi:hypothetical protein